MIYYVRIRIGFLCILKHGDPENETTFGDVETSRLPLICKDSDAIFFGGVGGSDGGLASQYTNIVYTLVYIKYIIHVLYMQKK